MSIMGSTQAGHRWPRRAAWALLLLLAFAGLLSIARDAAWLAGRLRHRLAPAAAAMPSSRQPGPPRSADAPPFVLDDTNSLLMAGSDDPWNERWADISGNYYSAAFIAGFSYTRGGSAGPQARVRIDPSGPTLSGRLEARRLKPSFVYQIKVRGDFAHDPEGAEMIGYAGRWRLPGRPTNYTDADYRDLARKDGVEAYLLFDYFVTDEHGDAVRTFALDSSLHVLWNAARQRSGVPVADTSTFLVTARDPAVYLRPKGWTKAEQIWAERERSRYTSAEQVIRLPPHDYQAELVLTEESFHSTDQDGGYWATVFTVPVRFSVVPPAPADAR